MEWIDINAETIKPIAQVPCSTCAVVSPYVQLLWQHETEQNYGQLFLTGGLPDKTTRFLIYDHL